MWDIQVCCLSFFLLSMHTNYSTQLTCITYDGVWPHVINGTFLVLIYLTFSPKLLSTTITSTSVCVSSCCTEIITNNIRKTLEKYSCCCFMQTFELFVLYLKIFVYSIKTMSLLRLHHRKNPL